MFCTNLVFILGTLVLHEQLQALLSDKRLGSTTSSVTLLRLICVHILVIVSGLVRLTNHLALAKVPYDLHSSFRVADMPNSVCKIWVRLTTQAWIGT